jgi:hypothetical protein
VLVLALFWPVLVIVLDKKRQERSLNGIELPGGMAFSYRALLWPSF